MTIAVAPYYWLNLFGFAQMHPSLSVKGVIYLFRLSYWSVYRDADTMLLQ